jgi:thiol-disulfide isomerase/thioredoxin
MRWVIAPMIAMCAALNAGWIATHLDWLRPLVAGRPAPDFTLARIDGGPRVALGELRGQVVVVEFWATWCRPCLEALPHLDLATRRWGDRVVVLAVNVDDRQRAAALFADAGYRPVLLADDGETAERYGVHSLPHTVVIDAAGVVRAVTGRPADAIAAVERLLAHP